MIRNVGVIKQDIKGILVEFNDMGFNISIDYYPLCVNALEVHIYPKSATTSLVKYLGNKLDLNDPTCVAIFGMLFEYTKQNNYCLNKFNHNYEFIYDFDRYELSDEDKKFEYVTFHKVLEEKEIVSLSLYFNN
jgi:hypothetical protein